MKKRIKKTVWLLIDKNNGDVLDFANTRTSARRLKKESGIGEYLMIKKAEIVFNIL